MTELTPEMSSKPLARSGDPAPVETKDPKTLADWDYILICANGALVFDRTEVFGRLP